MKKILLGILMGIVLTVGIHFIKVFTFFNQFVDPLPASWCIERGGEWTRNYYWDTETWNFDFNWECL